MESNSRRIKNVHIGLKFIKKNTKTVDPLLIVIRAFTFGLAPCMITVRWGAAFHVKLQVACLSNTKPTTKQIGKPNLVHITISNYIYLFTVKFNITPHLLCGRTK